MSMPHVMSHVTATHTLQHVAHAACQVMCNILFFYESVAGKPPAKKFVKRHDAFTCAMTQMCDLTRSHDPEVPSGT